MAGWNYISHAPIHPRARSFTMGRNDKKKAGGGGVGGGFFIDTQGRAPASASAASAAAPLNNKANRKRKRDAREEEAKKEVQIKQETLPVPTAAPSPSASSSSSSTSSSDSDSDSDSDEDVKVESDSDANSDLTSDEDENDKQHDTAAQPTSRPKHLPQLTPNQLELRRLLTELASLTPAQRKAIPKNHPLSKRNIRKLGKEDRELRRIAREDRIKRKRSKRHAKTRWLEACKVAKSKGLPEPSRSEFQPKSIKVKVAIDKTSLNTVLSGEVLDETNPIQSSALSALAAAQAKYAASADTVVVPVAKKQKVDPRTALVAQIKAKEASNALLAQELLGIEPKVSNKIEPERDEFGFLPDGVRALKKKPEDRLVEHISHKRLANKSKALKDDERRIRKLARRQERQKKEAEEVELGLRQPTQTGVTLKKGTKKKLAKQAVREAKEARAAAHKARQQKANPGRDAPTTQATNESTDDTQQ